MTRVSQRSVSVFTGRSPNWVAKRKARKHKVILESVTQEKKKLRSVISFEAKAPPGYTFISAGDPHFTTTCKEICRRDGLKVYAVSTTPHTHTHGLSQHVHRIGYHFPSAVVADVCMDRGLYLTATGKAVSFYNIGSEAGRRNTDSASQITINTEARDVLKDLFPNIPDNDLNQIIKTAFQKGQRKVGTAVELPLARRAQLAVVAHIRHIYTNYDRLLKANSFHEARATVEQPTLAKLVEWRGDDENGKTVLEDVFREVIVISDDDDSDVEGEPLPLQGRDASVEVISSNAVVEELQMRPVNHGNPAPREPQVEHLDDEIASGFRFIPKPPKKTKIDRRGFSRYQAWDRALNRYRNRISGINHQFPSYSAGEHLPENRGLGREPSSHRTSDAAHLSVARCAFPNQRTVKSNLSRPQINPVAAHRFYELHHLAEPPNKRRGGAIGPPNMPKAFPLERADISEPETYSLQHSDVSSGPVFVSGPREIRERIGDDPRHPPWPPGHSHSRKMDEQDHVLPSIESPLPVEIKRPNSGHIEHLTRRMSGAFNFRSVTPHRQVHQGFPKHILPQESFQAHASKRRRVAYHEPIPMENPPAPNGPITLSTHSGVRNSTGEQVSVQNGPQTRRRYVVPVEPPYIGEHALGNAEDSSISTARFDCDPQILAPYGPTKGYDGQPFSYNRHVDSQNGYHISPDQFLTAFDTRYTVTSGSGRDRIIQPRWPDQTESHISRNTQESSCNEGKAPEVTGRRFDYTRGNKDPPLYKPAEKQRLYADGFVRPIDSWEPGMLEYRQAHQLSSGHMVENLPQMANPKLCRAQKRRVTSDILPSAPTHPPTHLDPLAKSPFPSQHSAAIGDQVLRHTDELLTTPLRLSRWKTPKLKSSWKT